MGVDTDCQWSFSLHLHSSNCSYIVEDPVINGLDIALRQREHGFSAMLGGKAM